MEVEWVTDGMAANDVATSSILSSLKPRLVATRSSCPGAGPSIISIGSCNTHAAQAGFEMVGYHKCLVRKSCSGRDQGTEETDNANACDLENFLW